MSCNGVVQVGDTFYWMVDSTIDFSIGSTPAPTDEERKVAEAKGILILDFAFAILQHLQWHYHGSISIQVQAGQEVFYKTILV